MIIEKISSNWVDWVKKNDPDSSTSYEVLYFGARGFINLFATFAICIIVGAMLGRIADITLAFSSFVILRLFSGGLHLKSLDICTIVSAGIITCVPYLSDLNNFSLNYFVIITLLIVTIYAPNNLEDTAWSPRVKPIFKVISIILVVTNLVFHSEVIALAFFLQALTLIRIRGGERE